MSKFIEYPQLSKVKEASKLGRSQWKLETRLVFEDNRGKRWEVPSGYVTDFASVPYTPLMTWLFRDHAHMSAILHDYLCTDYYPKLMSWREATNIFYEAMLAEGVSKWRAWIMRQGVMLYGITKKEEYV